MRALRLPGYCYPEITASSHMQLDRFEEFSRKNIDLVIYTPVPTRGIDEETCEKYKKIKYEELYGGHIKIHRFSLMREGKNPVIRALRYVLSNLIQYWKGIHAEGIDLIYSCSSPPTQGMLCGLVKKRLSKKYGRSVPMVYNLQDVFPDSLVTTGLSHEGSILWKIGRKVEDYTYRQADEIIVISNAIKENIMQKGVPEEKIHVVSNWIDTEAVRPVAKADNGLYAEFGVDRDAFTVVYAGNFGAAQGADIVLEAAKLLPEAQFVIFGGGAEYESAKEKAEDIPNVIINPLLPQERVSEAYSLGDVALIVCKPGVGNSGMPSKTWSIMACDTPIVASFDTDSELAKTIAEAKAGICVEPGDAEALAAAIRQAMETPMHTEGRNYVCRFASKNECVAKYVEIVKQVAGKEA